VRAPRQEAGREPRSAPAPVQAHGPAERTLALQRLAGNRATGRLLARWVRHPDPEQKSVMVPDASTEDFERFNPPQNT
jgi:hypothetical protein